MKTQQASTVVILSFIMKDSRYTKGALPNAVVILRDQTVECPLCWVWSNIPKRSSELVIELRWNWPNDISLGQTI